MAKLSKKRNKTPARKAALQPAVEPSQGEAIPFVPGMTVIDALLAHGHLHAVGYDSDRARSWCQAQGFDLEAIRSFAGWLAGQDNQDLEELERLRRAQTQARLARLNRQVARARRENDRLARDLARKDKQLAETLALIELSKKARAIWGGKS